MRKLFGAALGLVLAAGAVSAAETSRFNGHEVVSGEVMVRFDDAFHATSLADIAYFEGLQIDRAMLVNGTSVGGEEWVLAAEALIPTRAVVMRFDPEADAMGSVLDRLRSHPEVLSADPNYMMYASFTPNDPRYNQQWGYPAIGCTAAWDLQQGSRDVLVSVIDTGIDYTHQDANVNYAADKGHDFINNDSDPFDDHSHGTHVHGTIGAATNNGIGGAGVAPHVSIMAAKVLSAQGSGSNAQVTSGIDWSCSQGASVLNMSLGGGGANAAMEAAINDCVNNHNAAVVAASGNESATTVGYPARYSACIAVGATTQLGTRAWFSNRGVDLDLAAPGQGVLSTVPGNGYSSFDGTSMATPHAAGVAALLFSQIASATVTTAAVRHAMETTAQDLGSSGWDTDFGHGLVQADAALDALSIAP